MLWLLTSLMMTQVEEQQVAPLLESAEDQSALQGAATVTSSLNDDIRISALIYTSPQDWVVWMGGHKLRPQNVEGDGFQLQKVDETGVTLTLTDHPGKTFHLSPGERLKRTNGQIVD